jgi:aspartate-alanine antiporter
MEMLQKLFETAPVSALFLSVALGYTIGKLRIGRFRLGGMPGTLFAAILIGQIGVPVDENIKTLFFALFIYSLGYVSGPQFFRSLGRSTLDQVHLAVFSSAIAFATVWTLAAFLDLDKGTAAGLLAGATTESASVGTAGETLGHIGLEPDVVDSLRTNIAVTYAVTYLFGFTLVVFFVSAIAPRLLGIDLKAAAREYEIELGDVGEELEPGQEQAVRQIVVRVYRVTNPEVVGMTVEEFDHRFDPDIHIQQVARGGRARRMVPGLKLGRGDRVLLVGQRDAMVTAGNLVGVETGQTSGLEFIGETRDVVVTRREIVGVSLRDARHLMDPEDRRAVFATRIVRAGQDIPVRTGTLMQAGDVVTIYGPAGNLDKVTEAMGYEVETGNVTDYVYLGLGILTGMLIGMITVPIAGAPVALHTGGGCLISGLIFGWLRSKRPTFGSLPAATAIHLRDFGLAMFIASVGLAAGPEAMVVLKEKGLILPVLAVTLVLTVLLSTLYYARYVLKMHPVVICGALAGVLTCTPGLNAVVQEADSEAPVLGYTVPYAMANVFLTLLGPIIVLTV